MKVTYENQGTHSYLVYEVAESDIVDTMSLGMITNNKITGLAPAIYTQLDGKRFVKYNISSRVSAAQFFEGIVNRRQILAVFSGIVAALISAEEYMIDPEAFVMDLNYVYIDVGSYDINLICLPIVDMGGVPVDFFAFFKNIIFSAKFDQTENYDYVGRMINYLNNAVSFSLAEFKQILDELGVGTAQGTPMQAAAGQAVPAPRSVTAANGIPAAGGMASSGVNGGMAAGGVVSSGVNGGMAAGGIAASGVNGGMAAGGRVSSAVNNTAAVREASVLPPMQQGGQSAMQSAAPLQPAISPQADMSNVIAIPDQRPVPMGNAGGEEKKISMFTLLTHYSKENAALYKAQKNKGKTVPKGEKGGPESAAKSSKAARQPKASGKSAVSNMGFAIPGQERQPELSVPVQAAQVVEPRAAQPNVMNAASGEVRSGVGVRTSVAVQSMASAPGRANFGETTVLSGSKAGETTLLSSVKVSDSIPQPYLIRLKFGEKVLVNKEVFRVGKENSYVDYFIGDNTAISRSHANIISRGGVYYIVDTNSKNHTFVNGKMIQSNVEVEIVSGTRICLANEEFEFRIM